MRKFLSSVYIFYKHIVKYFNEILIENVATLFY